jgi:hypothetical protein
VNPKNATKAELLRVIDYREKEIARLQVDRRRAWEETEKARAEVSAVLAQKPELETFRDFANDLDIDPSGSVEEILVRAVQIFEDLQEKTKDWGRCDACGEEAKHHHCAACYSDPIEALQELLEALETPAHDAMERRLQREAVARIAESYTGRTLQLEALTR